MYTPHTITLCNAWEDPQTCERMYQLTVLEGVLVEPVRAADPSLNGMESGDTVALYIPFSVRARDAVTRHLRRYLMPVQYRSAADKTPFWTLEPSGGSSAVDCFFVRGVVTEPGSYQALSAEHEAYRISRVECYDIGREGMRHWKVAGR